MSYITAYETINAIWWVALLATVAAICAIFMVIQLCMIPSKKKVKAQAETANTTNQGGTWGFTYRTLRDQNKTLAVFGVLTFLFGSAALYIWWTDHIDRKVAVSPGVVQSINIDENKLRDWRSEEAGLDLKYSYMTKEGVPVFKDYSNPSKEVYRECELIITDEQRQGGNVWFVREVKMKITPRCANTTTSGENVPMTTPKPTPSASATTKPLATPAPTRVATPAPTTKPKVTTASASPSPTRR